MSRFDGAHIISYYSSIVTITLSFIVFHIYLFLFLCIFIRIVCILLCAANGVINDDDSQISVENLEIYISHLYSTPMLGVTPLEFHNDV